LRTVAFFAVNFLLRSLRGETLMPKNKKPRPACACGVAWFPT